MVPIVARSLSLALVFAGVFLAAATVTAGSGPARNLLLISWDTVRADHLRTYGYDRDTNPTVDRLARRGNANPMTYRGPDGHQYVVIVATVSASLSTA